MDVFLKRKIQNKQIIKTLKHGRKQTKLTEWTMVSSKTTIIKKKKEEKRIYMLTILLLLISYWYLLPND